MFDDEVATANLAMVASTTTSTYFTIQFGSFEPIEVKVPFSPVPISEDYIFSSLTCYQVSGEEESSESEEKTEQAIVKEVNLHSKTSRIDSPVEEKEAKPIEEKETKQTNTSTKEKKLEAFKTTKAALVISSQPLKGFTKPSQEPIVKHGTLPTKRTKKGFDPNAYRLTAKVGYNHEKPSGLGKLIPEAFGKEELKVSKAKGFRVASCKAGIGYTPPTSVHIPIRKASVSVISTNYEEEE
nr:hypothetical protein CFP56_22723 [Quercus suber]